MRHFLVGYTALTDHYYEPVTGLAGLDLEDIVSLAEIAEKVSKKGINSIIITSFAEFSAEDMNKLMKNK